MKYVIDWGPELAWVVLVAAVAQLAQMLAEGSIQEVLNDPEAWGIAALAAVARVSWAAAKNFIISRVGRGTD